jgi:hypothetical protein
MPQFGRYIYWIGPEHRVRIQRPQADFSLLIFLDQRLWRWRRASDGIAGELWVGETGAQLYGATPFASLA